MLRLVKIWQVSSCGKCMQRLEPCLLWQLKLTEFCVNLWCLVTVFFHWMYKWNTAAIKSLLLFMVSLFIDVLVERCVACQSRKSDFGWHRFRFSPCLMRWCVRGFKSLKRFWPYLIAFRSCAWAIIVFDVCLFFLSIFMKLSTVYAASLCTFVRFETMVWPSIRFDISLQNFKKPLDIFSHRK